MNKMDHKQPTEEENKETIPIEPSNENDVVKVGEITLSSRYYLVPDLMIMIKDLLKDKEVIKYLQLVQAKQGAGYIG